MNPETLGQALLSVTVLVGLVPLLPLLAAGAIALRLLLGRARGDAAEPPTARIAVAAGFAALVLLLAMDLGAALAVPPGQCLVAVWFASAGLAVNLSFTLDWLGLGVATLVAGIGWLTLAFAANYLHREPGFHRFYLGLCVFLAGMLLLVLAGNVLLAFVGWELAGIASYLLIAYAWQRPVATANAQFAFITNRIGDAGLLVGIGLAAWWFNSFEWPALAGDGRLQSIMARLLVFGFVIAALAKSAQLPFTPWIARALEGPTPSSAIFYGAVMVHAGVFLLLRLEPVLLQAPDVMAGLVVAGVATAVYAWLCGLVQTDVKSLLVFATVFQVALMFVWCGLGWFALAAWHLGLHAAWRAWQFLVAPSWLQWTVAPPAPPPAWLARRQWLYTAALQRFWLDRLADVLLARPTQSLAQDVRGFDERIIDRALGEPGRGRSAVRETPLVVADGLPGRLLLWVSEHLQGLEAHLSLRGRGGAMDMLLRRLGAHLRMVEALLEQPRYLMLAVMATFVVII